MYMRPWRQGVGGEAAARLRGAQPALACALLTTCLPPVQGRPRLYPQRTPLVNPAQVLQRLGADVPASLEALEALEARPGP